MPIRKTRTDAWEAKLSDEDRTKLYVLCGHLSYNTARLVAKKEMKLDLPGSSTFYRFLERMRAEDAGMQLARASQVQREIGLMSAKAGIPDLELVSSFQTMGAEAALKGDFKAMAQLIMSACDIARKGQKDEELRIANEKLKLAQTKEAAAVKTVKDTKLTPEEREQKLKEIFGL